MCVTGVAAGVTGVVVSGSAAHSDQRGAGGMGGKLADDRCWGWLIHEDVMHVGCWNCRHGSVGAVACGFALSVQPQMAAKLKVY